jgi:hypothetical protein
MLGTLTVPIAAHLLAPTLLAAAFGEVIQLGQIQARAGRVPGVVVAAPHGGFDPHTLEVARALAQALKSGVVTARGYRTEGHPLNVNRPTEGIPPLRETETARAHTVYTAWKTGVQRAAGPGGVKLYVEIHGNGRAETAGRIEVATVGITTGIAQRLKRTFHTVRRRLGKGAGKLNALDLWIEPVDRLVWRAGNTKRRGILANVPRALHVELPLAARDSRPVRRQVVRLLAELVWDTMGQTSTARRQNPLATVTRPWPARVVPAAAPARPATTAPVRPVVVSSRVTVPPRIVTPQN